MVNYSYLSFKKTNNRFTLKTYQCVYKNIMLQVKSSTYDLTENSIKVWRKEKKRTSDVCALFKMMSLYGNWVNIQPRIPIPNTDSGGWKLSSVCDWLIATIKTTFCCTSDRNTMLIRFIVLFSCSQQMRDI